MEKIKDDQKQEQTALDQVKVRPPTPKYQFADRKRDDTIMDQAENEKDKRLRAVILLQRLIRGRAI